MISISPFKAVRPSTELASQLASLPYDVMSVDEARQIAGAHPASFLHITRSEVDLPADVHIYSALVYEKAAENLKSFLRKGWLLQESQPCYYIYRLTMDGRSQTGLVCLSSVDDYMNERIKKHEFTRPDKELDRINHIRTTGAQTGNVFLAYQPVKAVDSIIGEWTATKPPLYDFVAEDGIGHRLWVLDDPDRIDSITELFHVEVPCTYIADGHHRAASAAKLQEALTNEPGFQTDFFLTTLFPANQLEILDYNRVVKDLHGMTAETLLKALQDDFRVERRGEAVKPAVRGEFGMYLEGNWYLLQLKEGRYTATDPVGSLDISILSALVLDKLLGIQDQRTDKRIDFVGGIRGLSALEQRVDEGGMALAFSLFPVLIADLFRIADAGEVMPPKSTWFEPKLRDGLLTHLIRNMES